MPATWARDAKTRFMRVAKKREVRARLHPGAVGFVQPDLEDDLRDAHLVVVWSSSVGVKALIAGIPVVAEAPWWICKSAAVTLGPDTDVNSTIWYDGREHAMQRLAWAQWNLAEITSGQAFDRLLEAQPVMA
jgi:hypothetical protein